MKKCFYDFTYGFTDFPNKVAYTFFFTGCNLHCPYCYNKNVVNGKGRLDTTDMLEILNKHHDELGFFPGVVLSGGEPTVNPEFTQVLLKLRGFPVALHTNGQVYSLYQYPYQSIVMSLKTSVDGARPGYLRDYVRAAEHYNNIPNKRLRIVDAHLGYIERDYAEHELQDIFTQYGWVIEHVDEIKID